MNTPKLKCFVVGISLCFLLIATRFSDLPHNFTAVTAVILFSAAYFRSLGLALGLSFGSLFVSDLFLGLDPIHFFVYGSLILVFAFSRVFLRQWNAMRLASTTLLSSLSFFVITNLGVWMISGLYAANLQGLKDCFVMALPFFRSSLMGDLLLSFGVFYSAVAIRALWQLPLGLSPLAQLRRF